MSNFGFFNFKKCNFKNYDYSCCKVKGKDDIVVHFSNMGQAGNYILQNEELANLFGVSAVLAATVSDNITNGVDPAYLVPAGRYGEGTVTATYSVHHGDKEYSFVSNIWDGVKNISVDADKTKDVSLTATNFVQVDIDFSESGSVDLDLNNLKRSFIATGDCDDKINLTSASNSETSWVNNHSIMTGKGDDKVIIGTGDASLIGTSIVTDVAGIWSQTFVNLGNGDDRFKSEDGVKMRDNVWGGNGKDVIITGEGEDNLYGDNGNDILNGGEDFDYLTGGQGRDKFVFSSTDGDVVTDFAATHDKLDIRDLIDLATGPNVLGNINDYLSISFDGTDTLVNFDFDGVGAGTTETVARLQGVDLTAVGTVNQLIATNVIDIA